MPDTAASETRPAKEVDYTGRRFGDYLLLRRLGRGAMAQVYLAEQSSLGRNVAFKVLRHDLATDETYVQRFHLEARAAARLVHASIVQIYEVGCIDDVHFIAQEYVQGQNLAELLARKGPPELPLAVAIMRQVAAALAKAAEQGIVHRDIKPENLMLSTSGEVKVADFGLARITQSQEQLKLTQVGVTMGSPLYMSPEQVEGKPLDPRSDIYSFGVTCFQMLSGQPPFKGDTALAVAVQHVKQQPPRLEELRPEVPPAFARIIHKMLAKQPADRYANGAEVLRDLRDLDIPGLAGEWPDDLDQWNTAEMVALSSARSAATEQLAAAMKASAETPALWRRRVFWIAILGAFVIGAALAFPIPEPSLLSDAGSTTAIGRLGSAQEQYDFALQSGSEEAWRSVIDHFPDDELYVQRAKKQLAQLYLNEQRYYEAMQIFDEFARLVEEPEYRAYGLAGQYVILSFDEEKALADSKLSEFFEHRERLANFDPWMARLVRQVIRKNASENKETYSPEIQQWLAGGEETEPEGN